MFSMNPRRASEVLTKKFSITWTIKNYSRVTNSCITSFEFMIDTENWTSNLIDLQQWTLELFPHGEPNFPSDVSCYLRRSKNSGRTIYGNYMLQLIGPNGQILSTALSTIESFHEDACTGMSLIKSEWLDNEMKKWNEDVLTVHCRLNIQTLQFDPPVAPVMDLKCKSDLGFNENTFIWHVKEPDSSEWSLENTFICADKLSLNVTLSNNGKYIMIEMKNISKVDWDYFNVTSKISVMDSNKLVSLSKKDSYCFRGSNEADSWKFPNFITKKALIKKQCIKNGHFNVMFEFLTPNGIMTKEIYDKIVFDPDTKSKEKRNILSVLQNDLNQIYVDKRYTDVSLRADGQLFSAHKCVLSTKSAVFQAMFDSENNECKTNIIDINDMDSVTLGCLLKFLYTGAFDNKNWESNLKMLLAAKRYEIDSLFHKAAEMLMSQLSSRNVLNIIAVAHSVKHKDLKMSALELIKEKAKFVLGSEEWVDWSKRNINLGFEINVSMLALNNIE